MTAPRAHRKRKLSDVFVAGVKPAARKFLVWDAKQPLLALSVQPSGAKAWKFIYRSGGRPRWLTIGNAAAIGLADARRIAARLALKVADGGDPQAERMAQRGAGTFQELALRFRTEFSSKHNKSWRQAAALIDRYVLPTWGKLRASEIKRADVAQLMGRLDATPALGNQVLAAASVIFSWGIKQELVELNPCRLVDRNAKKSRERVLSDSEITTLWPEFSPALKMLLLLGQRPGEVACMRREHIKDGWWEMPGQPELPAWPGTKNGTSHRVWLPQQARALFDEFLDGDRQLRMDKEMRDICKRLAVKDKITPHDLRRTHGSTITRLGFGRDAMNRIQNHREGGIATVYDRYEYERENKRIMEAVAKRIVMLTEGSSGENVVEATGKFRRK